MVGNEIKSYFRSSKSGGGGGIKWPACIPFEDIHSICPWANTPILVIFRNGGPIRLNECILKYLY